MNEIKSGLVKLKQALGVNRFTAVILLIGFIGGFAWLASIRYFVAQPEEVHYHANFAVYINGQREEFKFPSYYEEVAACTAEYANNPKGRTHMHDQINDVIHVHDSRVTYGNFFQVLGWGIGKNHLATPEKVYVSGQDGELTLVLNGEEIDSVTNKVIDNLDKLLVSFGDSTPQQLINQYLSISDTAEEKNKYQDPSSCSGLNGAGHDSFTNKLKRATFWADS